MLSSLFQDVSGPNQEAKEQSVALSQRAGAIDLRPRPHSRSLLTDKPRLMLCYERVHVNGPMLATSLPFAASIRGHRTTYIIRHSILLRMESLLLLLLLLCRIKTKKIVQCIEFQGEARESLVLARGENEYTEANQKRANRVRWVVNRYTVVLCARQHWLDR